MYYFLVHCTIFMQTKEKILQKALELFNTYNYSSISVRDIARSLKMSPGNLSYHFAKKEDILTALLEDLKTNNSKYYQDYKLQKSTKENFLRLMENIFHSQFSYRGVLIAKSFLLQTREKTRDLDYDQHIKTRKRYLKAILSELNESREILVIEDDMKFLVSFISLLERFWLLESKLEIQDQDQTAIVKHYVGLLERQLELFTPQILT